MKYVRIVLLWGPVLVRDWFREGKDSVGWVWGLLGLMTMGFLALAIYTAIFDEGPQRYNLLLPSILTYVVFGLLVALMFSFRERIHKP